MLISATPAADRLAALLEELDDLLQHRKRERRRALLELRLPNTEVLDFQIADLEKQIDNARVAAAYEADAPKRRTAADIAEQKLFTEANDEREQLASKIAAVVDALEHTKNLAARIAETVNSDNPISRFRHPNYCGAGAWLELLDSSALLEQLKGWQLTNAEIEGKVSPAPRSVLQRPVTGQWKITPRRNRPSAKRARLVEGVGIVFEESATV